MANSALGSLNIASEKGTPLPHVEALTPLYANGNEVYMGGVVMIAGPPGGRKTMFMLWLANQLDLPVLYFSCDSDAAVMASRLGAMRLGVALWKVKDMLRPVHPDLAASLAASKITFSYHPSPGILDIEDEINAWVEAYEQYPPIIVIDNLLDMAAGGDLPEHAKHKEILKELKTLARDTGSCVFVLHHMLESGDSYASPYPRPRSALAGKVSQTPAQIWSIASKDDKFYFSIVKDRNGPDDANAEIWYTLNSDPEQCTFSALTPSTQGYYYG